jgi:uncharacterized membrane protein
MTTTFPTLPAAPAANTPENVLAIALDDSLLGRELVLAATRLGRKGSIELTDAAVVSTTSRGKPRISQTRDTNPLHGAWLGSWWGGLIGIVALGLAGWIIGAVAGAGLGWLRARQRDVGVPDEWMRGLVDRLDTGEVAAVFEIRNVYPTHLLRELRRFDGRLLVSTVAGVDSVAVETALDQEI